MLQKPLKSIICLLLLFVFCLPKASYGQTEDTTTTEQPKTETSQTVETDKKTDDSKPDSKAGTLSSQSLSLQPQSLSTSIVPSTGTTAGSGGSMINPILNSNLVGELTKYNSMTPFNTGEVDASGAFNYSYPINLPPGTNGMEPKLALVYNSNRGNGMLGMGWDLDGIPVITRDTTYDVTFDDTKDHYLYYGEKLIYTDPAQGGDGYYHTERESFIRFKLEYPNGSNSYWVATLKNGTKMYFGYQASEHTSQTDGHVDAVGKNGKALVWSLSKVMDIQGNYYVVEYNEDATNGDYYPVRVTYTKNGTLINNYKTVEFFYESRNDYYNQYLPTLINMDKRLKWVVVKVGANLLRKYRLDYEYGISTGKSRLAAIQEYGDDGNWPENGPWVDGSYQPNGRKFPVQKFSWDEANNQWNSYPQTLSFGRNSGYLNSNEYPIVIGDWNGDGKTDIGRVWSQGVIFLISTGNGWVNYNSLGGCAPVYGFTNNDLYPVLTGDWNGDGRTDFGRVGGNLIYFYLSTENGWNYYCGLNCCTPSQGFTNSNQYPILIGDWNGDGRTDFGRVGDSYNFMYISTGNSWLYLNSIGGNVPLYGFTNDYMYPILSGDWNGDGYTDLGRIGSDRIYFLVANNQQDAIRSIFNNNYNSITITYTPAPQLPGAVNPTGKTYPNIADSSPRPLVTKISVSNGLTGDSARTINTSYKYSDGMFHQGLPYERAGLGFAWIKKTDDNTGNTEITYYRQDDLDYRGMIAKKEQLGPNGEKYLETSYTYTKTKIFSNIDGINFVSTIDEYLYNYNGESGDPVEYHTSYTYDDYGNIIEKNNQGDVSVTTDDTREVTQYEINTDDWVMQPKAQQLFAKKLDGQEGLAAETRYTYTNYLPTREERENGDHDVVLTYGYDEYGNLTSTIDGNNRTTTITYDETYHTMVWKVTNPLNQTVETIYDNLLRPIQTIDLNGVVWETTYDEFSRELLTIAPGDGQDQPTVRRSYPEQFPDSEGNPIFPQRMLIEKKGVNGDYLQCYIYMDGLNRVIQEKTEAKNGWDTIDYYYDNSGRQYKISLPYRTGNFEYTDPDATVASRWAEYDPLNRTTVVHHSDTTTSQYIYGKYDNFTVDRNGHVTNKRITGNIEEDITYKGVYPSRYQYAKTTKLIAADGIKVTDALGNVFTTDLDLLGQKIQSSDPVQGTWSYVYDGNGNLVQYTDAKHQTIVLRYDAVNRLVEKEYPNGSTVNLYYDETGHGYSIGRLTGVSYPGGGEHYEYDSRGRKIGQTQTIDGKSKTQSYTYDSMDRILTQTYPDGEVVNYTYEENGNVKTLAGATAYVENIEYSPLCKISSMRYGNGVQTLYDYYDTTGKTDPSTGKNLSYRLRQIRVSGPAGDLLNLSYQYDRNSNVMVKQDLLNANLTENYGYDELDRLVGADSTVYGHKTYRYDELNNILEKDNRLYTYNPLHPYAVANDGRFDYTYDANGSITGRSDGREISWDYDNRVTSISDSGSFVYDSGFRRIKKYENGKTTLYFFKDYEEEYQGGVLSKATKYYFANDMRVAENSSTDGVRWYHKDHLGSSSAVSDVNGNLILRRVDGPYGSEIFASSGLEMQYTFTDKEQDGSDWFYFGARYYDPELGRFLSVDPLEDGLNWYAYCNGNPVKYVDPNGLYAIIVNDTSRAGTFGHTFTIVIDPQTGNGLVYSFGPKNGKFIDSGHIEPGVIPSNVLQSRNDTLTWLSSHGEPFIDNIGLNNGLGDVSFVWIPMDEKNTNNMISYFEGLKENTPAYIFPFYTCTDVMIGGLDAGGLWGSFFLDAAVNIPDIDMSQLNLVYDDPWSYDHSWDYSEDDYSWDYWNSDYSWDYWNEDDYSWDY